MIKKSLFFLWLLALLIGFTNFIGHAHATAGDFSITYAGQPGPLFNETNFAPLDSVTKQITITNNSSSAQNLALNLQNLVGVPDGQLAGVLKLEVLRTGNILSANYLSDLKNTETYLENLPASATYTYDIKVTMDNVGNEYQGINTRFDLVWGFLGADITHGGSPSQEILGASTGPAVSELPQTGYNAF